MTEAAAAQARRRVWWPTVRRLRLWSALVLFAFVLTHFINHGLGLISIRAMDEFQTLRFKVTHAAWGEALLVTAALVHFALGIARFLRARTFRLGWRNIVQLAFGLLIPVFLVSHVMGMRGAYEAFGVNDYYDFAFWSLWPDKALNQAILMLLVWVHACIGLHHWLSGRLWYRRHLWLWYGLAVLIPALSYAGFVTASRTAALGRPFKNPFEAGEQEALLGMVATANILYTAIVGLAVAVWAGLLLADRFRPRIAVSYAERGTVQAPRGFSVLDISRMNRIPHASVCGGRARCSTCRVRVIAGLDQLPPASDTEQAVLNRVGAPANVRLACQLRPQADLTVSTLLPANMDAAQTARADKYLWGVEQEVTLLFCDIRGFTTMSEGRLSFDVVFLLNQFLGRMAEAIEDTGGFVDKFMGDGIMAIFGMDETAQRGAEKAIAAARAMGGALEALNQSLREELPAPLSMGIGIHTGPAILGRIGAGGRAETLAPLTALGATVNLASRLESKTKDLGVQAVVSADCMAAARLSPSDRVRPQTIEVRGMAAPVTVWTAQRATDLPAPG
jgi:adenylate cyclase